MSRASTARRYVELFHAVDETVDAYPTLDFDGERWVACADVTSDPELLIRYYERKGGWDTENLPHDFFNYDLLLLSDTGIRRLHPASKHGSGNAWVYASMVLRHFTQMEFSSDPFRPAEGPVRGLDHTDEFWRCRGDDLVLTQAKPRSDANPTLAALFRYLSRRAESELPDFLRETMAKERDHHAAERTWTLPACAFAQELKSVVEDGVLLHLYLGARLLEGLIRRFTVYHPQEVIPFNILNTAVLNVERGEFLKRTAQRFADFRLPRRLEKENLVANEFGWHRGPAPWGTTGSTTEASGSAPVLEPATASASGFALESGSESAVVQSPVQARKPLAIETPHGTVILTERDRPADYPRLLELLSAQFNTFSYALSGPWDLGPFPELARHVALEHPGGLSTCKVLPDYAAPDQAILTAITQAAAPMIGGVICPPADEAASTPPARCPG